MEQHVAAEHLQVIRTLMERSALYRRTLGPIMLYVGAVGGVAALGGIALGIEAIRAFGAWWLVAAVVAIAGAFTIARRQALQDGERFWSPPALRVTRALLPPLVAGLLLSLALAVYAPEHLRWLFVLGNALFYGCAVHAAGFFMPRGINLFGWLIIVFASAAVFTRLAFAPGASAAAAVDHALMGGFFGGAHLAYSAYLFMTEPEKTQA
ncbi:MAG: hypothetical protein R6V57_17050 [Vicinamibacterales bacterium]